MTLYDEIDDRQSSLSDIMCTNGTNVVVLHGQIVADPRFHFDGQRPRVCFTVRTPNGQFYVEGTGLARLRDACFAQAGSVLMVVGSLFRRGDLVGISAAQIVPMSGGSDADFADQRWAEISSAWAEKISLASLSFD